MSTVGVIGATGRIGQRAVARCQARGIDPIAFGRNPAALERLGTSHRRRLDLRDLDDARAALSDIDVVVCCVRPNLLGAILAQLSERTLRVIAIGSTRKFTRFPDRTVELVLEGERALAASGRAGFMLHPTMTYGAGEANVPRLLAWLRKMPVVPLPAGGRSLIQPVHADDVAEAVVRAAILPDPGEGELVVAGPEAMPYAVMIRTVAAAFGHRAWVVPVPLSLALAMVPAVRWLPGLPRIRRDEVRRLTEDKDFDIAPLRQRLGLEPMSFPEGLARMRAEA